MRADAPHAGRPLGAVLAGGAARRLGGAKATAELGGAPLIGYPLGAFAAAGIDAVVVAKRNSVLPALGAAVVTEPDEPRHPLAGVLAALRHAGGSAVLVCACDTPFVRPATLEALAASGRTTIAQAADRIHPLLALYGPYATASLERAVETGGSAVNAAENLSPNLLEVPEDETFNVNTPADLALAETMLKQLRS